MQRKLRFSALRLHAVALVAPERSLEAQENYLGASKFAPQPRVRLIFQPLINEIDPNLGSARACTRMSKDQHALYFFTKACRIFYLKRNSTRINFFTIFTCKKV
jgi:hypothetical protein